MNAKRKESRNEHRSILLLESAGYACTRAAVSLGAFAIVGIGPTDVILMQWKTRDWPGAVEIKAIRNFDGHRGRDSQMSARYKPSQQ